MRIAIVASPRSGNSWLRHLLVSLNPNAADMPVPDPDQVDWNALPPDCVMHLHKHRTPEFLSLLEAHGFRVVTLARHPLDVLVSLLQFYSMHLYFALKKTDDENPDSIFRAVGASPCSDAFLDYVAGSEAADVLSYSREWWQTPGSFSLRYEDLVRNTPGQLQALVDWIGVTPARSIEEAITSNTMNELRKKTGVWHHFWQGRPDLWRCLLPAQQARRIAEVHADSFSLFGYACDPDPELTTEQAEMNWIRFNWSSLYEKIKSIKSIDSALRNHQDQQAEAEKAKDAEIVALHQTVSQLHQSVSQLHQSVSQLHMDTTSLRDRLQALEALGRFPLGLARRTRRFMDRFPTLTRLGKRLAAPLVGNAPGNPSG